MTTYDEYRRAHAARITRQLHEMGYTNVSEAEALADDRYYAGIFAGIQWGETHDTPGRTLHLHLLEMERTMAQMQRLQAAHIQQQLDARMAEAAHQS